jgi:hypothetical protein
MRKQKPDFNLDINASQMAYINFNFWRLRAALTVSRLMWVSEIIEFWIYRIGFIESVARTTWINQVKCKIHPIINLNNDVRRDNNMGNI